MYKIVIYVGGIFTDFVVAGEEGQPRFFKTQSTPDDPSIGVTTGLQEAAAAYGLSLVLQPQISSRSLFDRRRYLTIPVLGLLQLAPQPQTDETFGE